MSEKKKKRTILLDEDESKVTDSSLASKVKSFASEVAGKFSGAPSGVVTTFGSTELSVGVIKSVAKDVRGERKSKPKLGAKVKFEF